MVRSQVARFRGDMLAARGDSLGASFDGPARAIRCAEAIVATPRSGARCRAGLHTGECEPHDRELRGVAVDVAAEILARAAPGEVLVSRTVADLVAGARIGFADRGSPRVGRRRRLVAAAGHPCRGSARGAAADGPAMLFRREGDYWTVAFGGQVIRMHDAKGLGYLARLLRHPHREFHVLDLLAGDAPRGSDAAREDGLVVGVAGRRSRAGRARQARLPRADRRPGDGDRAGAPLERRRADRARRGRARCAEPRARRCAGPRGTRPARRLGQRARADERDQGACAERWSASGTRFPSWARHLALAVHTGTFCSYDARPEGAGHLGRLRSPP